MSAAEAAECSSRARHDADPDPEPEPPQRSSWVALVSKAVVFWGKSKEGRKSIPRGEDFHLDREHPPRPSYLLLRHRAAPTAPVGYVTHHPQQTCAHILAADRSGLLLVQVVDPGRNDPGAPDLFFCDTHARTTFRLPAVPSFSLRIEALPDASIGLIGNKEVEGSYLLAQLHPRLSSLRGDRLLCYSTTTLNWFVKPLKWDISVIDRTLKPCSEAAVLAHDGRLWWVALAYGVFFCEPFEACPVMRFVPLPPDCEVREEVFHFHRVSVAERRLLAPSEGQLRYVEVRGFSFSYEVEADGDAAPPPVNPTVSMWTLVDPEAAEPWRFEYEANFADVWDHDSYVAAGLPRGVVPHVALVDPADHGVVHFFQANKIFGLDVRARRVVSCEDCLAEDYRRRQIFLRNTLPIIHSWQLCPRRREVECWRRSEMQMTDQRNFFPHPAPPRQQPDSSSSSDGETEFDKACRSISGKMQAKTEQGAVKKLQREHEFIDSMMKALQQVEEEETLVHDSDEDLDG